MLPQMLKNSTMRTGWRLRALPLLTLVFNLCGGGGALATSTGEPVLVAAASSLRFAMADLASTFTRSSGVRLNVSFGSSGNFSRQIRQGAPHQIFFSADERYVEDLVKADLTRGEGDVYATGRIVLFIPAGSPIAGQPGLEALGRSLAGKAVKRFAVANPDHAPYGRAAREALQSAGLWEEIKARIVMGENVSQAAQFATSGSTDGGIFAYSIAKSAVVGGKGRYVLLSETLHTPIRQRMVLLKRSGEAAAAFYTFMKGSAARAILGRHGFSLPPRD